MTCGRGLQQLISFFDGLKNFFSKICEFVDFDVTAAVYLFDDVEVEEAVVWSVSRVHSTYGADDVGWRGLDVVGDLRGIASTWCNVEEVFGDFLPYATSP